MNKSIALANFVLEKGSNLVYILEIFSEEPIFFLLETYLKHFMHELISFFFFFNFDNDLKS